ncbi:hypothetical protein [Legionella sp.]
MVYYSLEESERAKLTQLRFDRNTNIGEQAMYCYHRQENPR